MSSVSGFSGVYAVDWSQVQIADTPGLGPDALAVGLSWRWTGEIHRLDAPSPVLALDRPRASGTPRDRVRRRAERIGTSEPPPAAPEPDLDRDIPSGWLADGFSLTDGHRLYVARLLRLPGRTLAVFDPLAPPPGRDLWVVRCQVSANRPERTAPQVICFLPGTMIDTPHGPRPIESLHPGALVLTRDSGAMPVEWLGETELSGAELSLHPELRPIRLCAGAFGSDGPRPDLLVSPGHRLLRPAPHALGGEVLIAARDLVDGRAVRRDFSLARVRYLHLMLARHEIITANGLPCESFHPGLADERVRQWHARTLERVRPGITRDPWILGEPARRCLDSAEAALATAVAA